MTTARVTELTYYPVKGCAGIPVPHARLTPAGLAHDRAYVITDENGEPRWQWGDPALALITPEHDPETGTLTLRAPGHEPLRVDDSTERGRQAAARWLTRLLGRPTRLRRDRPDADGRATGTMNRLHVVSRASLTLLNRKLGERGAPPLPMNRFRPNLVIDGWSTPHTEDTTAHLSIAGTELTFTERTIRCAVTMVDQETGHRSGPEPLRTLSDYRREAAGVAFGAYFAVARAGEVAVGDAVTERR
ncbi:MOSC domain-containing protein [Streptomyces sp. NPDC088812]|uniref:MOSC domain-containing protein n=1 Tax=Streptomyces sp. NPDC088812 TaxID=3365905 RepID=UPI0038166502